jgi:hypothetical protein
LWKKPQLAWPQSIALIRTAAENLPEPVGRLPTIEGMRESDFAAREER